MSCSRDSSDVICQEVHQYLGSTLCTILFQSVECGCIIGQFVTFWSYASTYSGRVVSGTNAAANRGQARGATVVVRRRTTHEKMLMMGVAFFVVSVSMMQTSFSISGGWRNMVSGWGSLETALTIHRLTQVQTLMNLLLSLPVHGFLIWRCWILTNQNFLLLGYLLSLTVAQVTVAIIFTVSIIGTSAATELDALSPYLISSLVIPAMLDFSLCGFLFTYLLRSRRTVISRRFKKTLELLMLIVWEAAFPPCLCSATALIIYLVNANQLLWSFFFQALLGQLYAISFFVTLNGFLGAKNLDTGGKAITALGGDWVASEMERQMMNETRFPPNEPLGVNITINVQTTHDPTDVHGMAVSQSLSARISRMRKQVTQRPSVAANDKPVGPLSIQLPKNPIREVDETDSDSKGGLYDEPVDHMKPNNV